MPNNCNWITPNWPAPPTVKALTTLRARGNFGIDRGNDPNAVLSNRQRLCQEAQLPQQPYWLKQVHGNTTVNLDQMTPPSENTADASVSFTPGQVCVALTADCLPILICDDQGTRVSAIHAGWRGLSQGIIESAVHALETPALRLMAWLGPAIGPNAFEVGLDVKQAFPDLESDMAFNPISPQKWMANLYLLATTRLNRLGITQVFGGGFCTFTDSERFFSFRRLTKFGDPCGNMATLIWITG